MSAKLTLKQRILVGFVLALAFFLVLGSNLVDRRHFSTIQKTIESIHDDRVVVQDYIYQLRNFLHDTEVEVLETGNIEKSRARGPKLREHPRIPLGYRFDYPSHDRCRLYTPNAK